MNTLKQILITTIFVTLCGCGEQATPAQAPSYFLVLEDGGTITADQQEHMRVTTLNLLQQMTQISRYSATRNARINILKTSRPNQISWSGTAQQLAENVEEVVSLVSYANSYSDLVYSYEQIASTIEMTQAVDVRIYHIGVFIHAGYGSSNGELNIKLPQDIPELALSRFLDRVTVLRVINYHPDQTSNLIGYFSKLGAFSRKSDGSLDFEMMGNAQTKANLLELL